MEKKILLASALLATIVIVIFSLMQASSVVTDAQYASSGVPFTRLMQGETSGVTERVNYVLTSSQELNALWKIIGATSTPPQIDFKSEAVLAVFAGESAQTRVAIARIEDAQGVGKRIVSVVLVKPEGSCATEKSSLSPFEIVSMAASPLPLTHEDIVATTSCSN